MRGGCLECGLVSFFSKYFIIFLSLSFMAWWLICSFVAVDKKTKVYFLVSNYSILVIFFSFETLYKYLILRHLCFRFLLELDRSRPILSSPCAIFWHWMHRTRLILWYAIFNSYFYLFTAENQWFLYFINH